MRGSFQAIPVGTLVKGLNGMNVDVYADDDHNLGLRSLQCWVEGGVGIVLKVVRSGVVVYRILWSTGAVGWSYDYVLETL